MRSVALRRLLCALLFLGLLGTPGPAFAARAGADDGSHVVATQRIDDRTVDLTIDSVALGRTAKVRLLLPADWQRRSARSWPVLYLLHGANDPADYRSWTRYTDVERFTERRHVIIAMPTAARLGFYSNWWNGGRGGPPGWETFHLDELRQILERGFHAGGRRAVAGVSMGGYGAMQYAERRPGMFRAAASYSGLLDTTFPGMPQAIMLLEALDHVDPARLWGDPSKQWAVWRAHNPYANAARLRGTALYVSGGSGAPGPGDPPQLGTDVVEALLSAGSRLFVDRLQQLGIPAHAHFYSPGQHNWTYWQRELHRSWPMLMRGLGQPARPD